MEKTKNSYKKSGVNIDLANSFVKHIAKSIKKKCQKKEWIKKFRKYRCIWLYF